MIGRLLCAVGLHKVICQRWGYDLSDGTIDWKIVRCDRARCMWGRKLSP